MKEYFMIIEFKSILIKIKKTFNYKVTPSYWYQTINLGVKSLYTINKSYTNGLAHHDKQFSRTSIGSIMMK